MFKFFLVKNFVDVWENIFHVILLNIFMMIVFFGLATLWFVQGFFSAGAVVSFIIYFVFLVLLSGLGCTVLFAEGKNAAAAARAEGVSFRRFFKALPGTALPGLEAGFVFSVIFLIARYSLPYYVRSFAQSGNFVLLLLAAFVFWFLVVTVLSVQYLIPVMNLLGNGFFKSLKKCYIIFFDNTLFSIGLTLLNAVSVLLSVVTFGLAPGFCGIIFNVTNALKIRLYKYDWLEVNPDLTARERKDVPWAELLVKEKEMLGPHPIKNALMPWKQI
ncbi:hypothetical protein [Treponema sp.]|uniref:hypothetical protein n=1 Tax=Treponema sp. TaxID=166 RepID=UPI00257CAE6D|nr:hypothetical protein [Treponema sp.]MBE6354362.1 hypothetical protein [Treponema sp.]